MAQPTFGEQREDVKCRRDAADDDEERLVRSSSVGDKNDVGFIGLITRFTGFHP